MVDQRKRPDLRVEFKATRIAKVRPMKIELTDEFASELIALIQPLKNDTDNLLRESITSQANIYLNSKQALDAFMTSKESRTALKRLDRPFRVLIDTIDKISLDYEFVLDQIFAKEIGLEGERGALLATRLKIEKLQTAVHKTLHHYKLKGGGEALHLLEQCVGTLMLLIETTSGKRASASMTKDGEHLPRTTSPQGQAIVELLTAIDEDLEPVSVIRKIISIRRKYPGQKLRHFSLLLWAPQQKITPIPASPKR